MSKRLSLLFRIGGITFLIKKLIISAILFLFTIAGPAAGAEVPNNFKLNRVTFKGVQRVSKDELSKTLVSRAPLWWKFWIAKPVLSREDLDGDLLRIKQFYKDYGFYHTKATYQAVVSGGREGGSSSVGKENPKADENLPLLNVTFSISEGPPVIIKTVEVKINPPIKNLNPQAFIGSLALKTDQVFELGRYRQDKKNIQKRLANRGYPFTELSGSVKINTVANTAEVLFSMDPQRQHTFGKVTILKNDAQVKEIVVQRAMAFKEGETYSADKVEKSQRNLFNLDVFRLAVIRPGKPGPDADAVPMNVELKAKKRQKVSLGVGFGTEDGFRVKGAWAYRNLWGWAGKLSLNAKRSDLIQSIYADYTQPYFMSARNNFSSKGGFERENYASYTNRKIFVNTVLSHKLEKKWTWSNGYNLEVNDLEDIKIFDQEELEQLLTERDYFISSIQTGLTYDTTRNIKNPEKGNVASFSVEWATGILGSELDYLKPSVELRRYQPVTGKLILAGRIRFEIIESDDPLPIFKRLFLGGSNTVRGYEYQKLPPLAANGNPLGGQSSVNANVELRHPLYKKLSGVVFLDAGLVELETFKYDLNDMRYSCGAGVRYNTIVGPLRLDVGYKLNPAERDKKNDLWRIHFSIGEAF
jgi:outer membrane protein assembly complex protein YaeT